MDAAFVVDVDVVVVPKEILFCLLVLAVHDQEPCARVGVGLSSLQEMSSVNICMPGRKVSRLTTVDATVQCGRIFGSGWRSPSLPTSRVGTGMIQLWWWCLSLEPSAMHSSLLPQTSH